MKVVGSKDKDKGYMRLRIVAVVVVVVAVPASRGTDIVLVPDGKKTHFVAAAAVVVEVGSCSYSRQASAALQGSEIAPERVKLGQAVRELQCYSNDDEKE
jgi:hypothetical protein